MWREVLEKNSMSSLSLAYNDPNLFDRSTLQTRISITRASYCYKCCCIFCCSVRRRSHLSLPLSAQLNCLNYRLLLGRANRRRRRRRRQWLAWSLSLPWVVSGTVPTITAADSSIVSGSAAGLCLHREEARKKEKPRRKQKKVQTFNKKIEKRILPVRFDSLIFPALHFYAEDPLLLSRAHSARHRLFVSLLCALQSLLQNPTVVWKESFCGANFKRNAT